MDIFDLSAKITLDSSEFEKGVNEAGGHMEGLSAKAVALGNAIYDIGTKAASAFGTLVKSAVGGYADFEQLVGGVDTLFKESSNAVQSYADNAYRTAGISANQYMETATSFAGSLLQSLAGDTEAAAAYADRAITDMSDNANKMGTSMDSIIATYQSLSRGNYAMLDNLKLGYGGTKAELERLLADADALSESFNLVYDANGKVSYSFADIVDAIGIVQTEMGITGTTAQEAATTISGSVASMKAAWENWLVGLGDSNADMTGLTDNLLDSVQTVWTNLEPVLGQIKTSLMQVFSELTGIDLSAVTGQFSAFSAGVQGFVNPLVDALQEGGLTGLFQELLTQFENLTGIDFASIFSGINTAFETVKTTFDNIKTTFDGFVQSFQEGGFTGLFDGILQSFQNLTGLDLTPFTGTIQMITTAFDGLIKGGVSGMLEAIVGRFEDLTGLDLSTVKEQLGKFGQAIDDIATAFAEGGLQGALDEFMQKMDDLTGLDVSGFFDGVRQAVDDLVQAFKEGGIQGLLDEFANAFKDAGPKILEFGKGILESVGQLLQQVGEYIYTHMPENIQGLIDSIGNFFKSLWEYLKVLWDQMKPLVEFIGVALVESIKTAFNVIKTLFDTIVSGLTHILDFLSAQFDIIVALWKGDFQGAAEAIKAAFDSVLAFFGDIVNGIMNLFEDLVGFFKDIGSRMWEGLKSGFSKAIDGIKDIAGDISEGFKDFFGIHSPSRLFEEYGRFMAQGLENGWNGEMREFSQKMYDSLTPKWNGEMRMGHVDFASSAIGKSSAAQISSMLSGMQERGGNYSINLVVDGRTLANVVFDPLSSVAKQKGVTLGA